MARAANINPEILVRARESERDLLEIVKGAAEFVRAQIKP
jgi:hypothetical protein